MPDIHANCIELCDGENSNCTMPSCENIRADVPISQIPPMRIKFETKTINDIGSTILNITLGTSKPGISGSCYNDKGELNLLDQSCYKHKIDNKLINEVCAISGISCGWSNTKKCNTSSAMEIKMVNLIVN